MVYTQDLKSCPALRDAGSIPALGTANMALIDGEPLPIKVAQQIVTDLLMRLESASLVVVAGEVNQRMVSGEQLTLADLALVGLCKMTTNRIVQEEVQAGVFRSSDENLSLWDHDVRAELDRFFLDATAI